MTRVDRVNASRALARAIAYRDCGKDQDADKWAVQLLKELQATGILRPEVLRARQGHMKKSEITPIAKAMMQRAALCGRNITWAMLANDIPRGIYFDHERHCITDGFAAIDAGEQALITYLHQVLIR